MEFMFYFVEYKFYFYVEYNLKLLLKHFYNWEKNTSKFI